MKSLKIYILPVFGILICFLAVNSWSLWQDETNTAVMFSVKSLSDFVEIFKIRFNYGSETQQPGFIISMWLWVKAFGNSEYVLRFPNIIYMLILLAYTFFLIKSKNTDKNEKLFLVLVLALTFLNPFILYNMNEARANLPTFFFSYMSLINLFFYYKKDKNYFLILCFVFAFLGALANMVFLFSIISLLVIAIFLSKNILNDLKANIKSISIFLAFMIPLIGYYLFSIYSGGGGQIEIPGLGNIGFSIYEFLGFSGLGPARNTLREINQNSSSINIVYSLIGYAGLILPLVICYLLLISLAIKSGGFKIVINNIFFKAFCIGFLVFFIAAFIVKFRFWGRHVIFLLPFLIFFIADILQKIQIKKNIITKFIIPIFFIMLAISSFRIIYKEEYKKDNVSLAALECKRLVKKGETIIWLDHIDTAKYYDVDKLGNPIIGLSNNNNEYGLLVWFKRYDYYDQHGIFKKYMNSKKGKIVLLFSHRDFNIYRVSQ